MVSLRSYHFYLMCTQPIKILNPSKWLASDRGQQLWLYVPCGHCVECRQRLQNEWRVRSYYECLDILRNGYALFDTLTYSNRYLPHVSDYTDVPKELDFSCFRSSDVTLFLKRLRIILKRLGYDPKDRLRYFLASEYGTTEGRTKRPHYHIIFFVKDSFVPNLVLSQSISRAWSVSDGFGNYTPIGRTDGLPYKSPSYVSFHNTFSTVDQSQKKVIMYVAKYVAKDFLYNSLVRDRLFRLMCDKFDGFDWQLNNEQRKYYQQLKEFVMPFHRQSLHFGDYYIELLGRDKILRDGFLKFNFDGTPLTFALFPSLKRKLLYNRNRVDGDYHWFLNNTGISFKLDHYMDLVRSVESDISTYNLNNNQNISFNAFDFLYNHNRLQSDSVVCLKDIERQLVLSSSCDSYNSLRNYCCLDRSFIHKSVLTKFDFGSKKHGFSLCNRLSPVHHEEALDSFTFLPFEDFCRYSLYFDKIERDYQKILDWKRDQGIKKLAVVRHKERLSKLFKSYNLC